MNRLPSHTVPVSLGWGYWATLAGAAAVLVVTLLPELPRRQRLARLVTAPA